MTGILTMLKASTIAPAYRPSAELLALQDMRQKARNEGNRRLARALDIAIAEQIGMDDIDIASRIRLFQASVSLSPRS